MRIIEKQVKTLAESNKGLKSEIVKLEKEWNQKHARLVDEASKNKRLLEADKAQLKGALESLNKAYQDNVESLNKSANDIANLRENLDGKENELQTIVNNLSSTLETLEAEKSIRLEKQLELEQHRQSSKELKTTNAELTKTIKNVESAAKSELETMQEEISQLKLLSKKKSFIKLVLCHASSFLTNEVSYVLCHVFLFSYKFRLLPPNSLKIAMCAGK